MRKVNSVKNPVWSDPTGFRIDMEVDFADLDEVYVPFTSYKNDVEKHSVDLFNRAVAGEFGQIAEYTQPSDITGDHAVHTMRKQRNNLLAETDYVENPTYWARLTEDQQTAWTKYRNALRDITDTVTNPVYVRNAVVLEDNPEEYVITSTPNFNWPTKPE